MSTEIVKKDSEAPAIIDPKIEAFNERMANIASLLNAPIPKKDIKGRAGHAYIPLSILEEKMDITFGWGLWGYENFKWERIFNELTGSIDLFYYHPATGKKIIRVGAAGVQIRLNKLSDAEKANGVNGLDPSRKFQNSLELDFPHLKADCLRNAMIGIGKNFGRDLRREDDKSAYQYKTQKAKAKYEAEREAVIKEIQASLSTKEVRDISGKWAKFSNDPEFQGIVQDKFAELEFGEAGDE